MEYANDKDFYPAPFPSSGLQTFDLQRISLAKLLNGDPQEGKRVFNIGSNDGFFYLDLTTHAKGLQILELAHKMHHIGKGVMENTPLEEKRTFPIRPAYVGLLDTGYKALCIDKDGNPDRLEMFNISQAGLFAGNEDYKLPPWLASHETIFRTMIRESNNIHNTILAILEPQLQIPTGSLTSLHRLTSPSGAWLRVLHYPATADGKPLPNPPTPPHKDAVSLAMLFAWQGGLQITPANNPNIADHEEEDPKDWYWVAPQPGCALINFGDAMSVLTNNVIKAGKHRVCSPPGEQCKYSRISVLTSARPAETTMMRPFKSPVIPQPAGNDDALTALQWGMEKVRKTLANVQRGNEKAAAEQIAKEKEAAARPQLLVASA
ncbi:Clavaminate synthase-like protein [Glonium stellatum]|uniref:Clavaminate synthase-like protein n=1 Tax=Glonium stellatum TaxID=574774 RepID=A0A8E2F6C8_9PEZI|nr:Clavaminate synthase-like protein [Glonium stellatum]